MVKSVSFVAVGYSVSLLGSRGIVGRMGYPMKNKKVLSFRTVLMAMLFSGILSQATAVSIADEEIGHLLDYVERSGCRVYRNGTWHSASDARAHLEKKYRFLLNRGSIDRTEDFIDRVATASSVSGNPYQVKCEGREMVSSAEWLTAELQRLRSAFATRP